MTLDLKGTFPALVTPMRDGGVDEHALRGLVARTIEGGVAGLVPCGSTGESVTLDDAEHLAIVRAVVDEAAGRVPVIAGAGTSSTRRSIRLAQQAKAAGADGLMLVNPAYNKPTQPGLEAHFRAIVAAAPLPTILYNIPGRTAVDLSADTLGRLADVPEIIGIKEATGTVIRAQQILSRFGDRFTVLAGDDALTLPMLAIGGQGVVSVTANVFPKETVQVAKRWHAGDVEGARAQHLRLLPVHQSMFLETNPGPVKAVLAEAGHVAPEVRAPLVWPMRATIDLVLEIARAAEVSS